MYESAVRVAKGVHSVAPSMVLNVWFAHGEH